MNIGKLQWLEAMRGIAAVWVVLYHANSLGGVFLRPLDNAHIIANGFLGVDFFFILSGFIIASSSNRLIEQGKGFSSFFRARAIRIYVPYLPVGAAIFLAYIVLPTLSASPREVGLLTSLTLLPTNSPPALNVAWTLVHEIIFYAVFSTIFISKRILFCALFGWGLAIVVAFYRGAESTPFEEYFLSPLNLCFLLGVLVFYLGRREMSASSAKLAGGVGLISVLWLATHAEPNRIAVAFGFSLLVAASASPRAARSEVWGFITTLGSASYAIYLVHNPLLSLIARGIREINPSMNPWLSLLVMSTISIAAGLAYWRFYERAALRVARNIIERAILPACPSKSSTSVAPAAPIGTSVSTLASTVAPLPQ